MLDTKQSVRFEKKTYKKPGGAAFDGLSRTSKPLPGQGEEHTQRRQSRSLVGSPSEFVQFSYSLKVKETKDG